METLILLGAGASYGSEPPGTPVPPLGVNLFDKLAARAGIASTVSKQAYEMFKDFEKGMAMFAAERSGDVQQFQRELAGYLAEFLPTSKSRYHKLLSLFDRKKTVYASLNYDLLLEEAMEASGYHPNYGAGLLYKHIRLLKPHGSANFWHYTPGFTLSNIIIEGGGTAFKADVRPRNRADTLRLCKEDDSFSPAMSLYAKGKAVKVCPDFVINQQRIFADVCSSVAEIYIIGVRVVPEDSHIWLPLGASNARLTYFGGESDRAEFSSWVEGTGRNNAVFVGRYFDEALDYMAGQESAVSR